MESQKKIYVHNGIKPVKPDYTEAMYKLQKKSLFTGPETHENFECLSFKVQTVAFEKPLYLGFSVEKFSNLRILEPITL